MEAPAMSEQRCALGVAIDLDQQLLIAAGGYGGNSVYLNSAEVLTCSAAAAADAQWLQLPPMSLARAGCNAAAGPGHRIYVVGGGPDGLREWDTMETIDLREGKWQTEGLARMRVGRHYNAGRARAVAWLALTRTCSPIL